ncbi:MAG: PD-(D/E)XK nuclease family protein [Candidatus Neomarinimicrobiota bacterium]
MIKRFSHSSIETFKKCPAQFKFRYLDKVRKPDEGVEAFMGKRVHEALEFLYTKKLAGKIPIVDTILDYYHAQWDDKWHERIAIVRKNLNDLSYRYLGEDCLARYFRTYAPFDQNVISVEKSIDFFIDENEDYPFRGIIDRLDEDDKGNWEIHDYKSGSNVLSQSRANTDSQLALYEIGIRYNNKNIKTVTLCWHFLQSGIVRKSNRTARQLSLLTNRIKSTVDEIRNRINRDLSFVPKESVLCNWCYYWEECPVKRQGNPHMIDLH